MILVAGDSWGCGEWKDDHTVVHGGLSTYLSDAGHNVLNLSHGGISNLDIISRIKLYLERFPDTQITKAFIFQTEFDRDFKHAHVTQDIDWDDIEGTWLTRFYQRLSELAVEYNFEAYLIGGCSDVMWFDDMSVDHPNCHIGCQSLTGLICNNNHRTSNPVYSWYSKHSSEFVQHARNKMSTKQINQMLDQIGMGFERESIVREHPQFFYPDGVHPNRQGHLILYNYLQKTVLAVDQ